MFPFDHDPTALRALLTADFEAICSTYNQSSQIEQFVTLLTDTTRSILRDLLARWNKNNSIMRLPPEIIALCFTFLPLRDRFNVSHVSQTWRDIALHYHAVWSHIDIDGKFWDPSNALAMALERGGTVPVSLKAVMWIRLTWIDNGFCEPTMPPFVERHMHRMRSLEWSSDYKASTDGPFPLLEYFKSDALHLSEKALTGPLGRLHTLDVDFECLPSTLSVPLTSVTHFVGRLPLRWPAQSPEAQLLPRLFALFPRLKSLALTRLSHSTMEIMPKDPPPSCLERLTLASGGVNLGTLVEHSLPWKTPQLKYLELAVTAGNLELRIPSAFRVPHFVSGAIDISVARSADKKSIVLAAKTADGGARRLVLEHLTSCAKSLAAAIWAASAHSYAVLRLVALPADILYNFLDLAMDGHFSSVETLVIQVDRQGTLHNPWLSLSVITRLPTRFPAVTSFALEVNSSAECGAPSAEDASALLHHLAEHGVPGLPVLRIRGFSREIVSALNPEAVAQLPMRAEFELPPSEHT